MDNLTFKRVRVGLEAAGGTGNPIYQLQQRLGNAVGGEQLVDGCIGGHERQAIGQFEAFLS